MNREQNKKNEKNDNGNAIGSDDVFAEVLKAAFAALYGDTATRRLAAGDIVHALATAYPGLGAAKAAHGEARANRGEPTGWERFLTVAPGLRLARYGAPGQPTIYVGKRVLPDQAANPAQVFEIRVDRRGVGPSVLASENGRRLFSLEFGGAHWIREYLAVKALKALLSARRKAHACNRRRRKDAKRRAKGVAMRADVCPF